MGRILVLPPDLASQIAAGEVVERPASAVKELVENAIDADATRCDVSIDGGGITALSVRDDGIGMSEQDARLSLHRHATSKLRRLEDLMLGRSYGFRGEALPALASVSRFTLRTRERGQDAGVELRTDGGLTPVVEPCGMAEGTSVELRDLFFNVPARRKFLRSSGTESGHVTDVLEGAALSQPAMTFVLTRDGRRAREWLRAQSREERVAQILDAEDLTRVAGSRGPLAVEAFLSRPERARQGAAGLRIVFNGRPVRDRAIAYTVTQAYGSVLERGRYPRGVVYLDLPPELLDVNVHPQKTEIRLADPRAVGDALYHVLAAELARAFSLPVPSRRGSTGGAAAGFGRSGRGLSARRNGQTERDPSRIDAQVDLGSPVPSASASVGEPDSALPADAGEPHMALGLGVSVRDEDVVLDARDVASPLRPGPSLAWGDLTFVAQLRATYLLCQSDAGFFVIDQHAAAERVNFDRLRKQYHERAVPSQSLLFPITLELTPTELELVDARGSELEQLGLTVEPRGSGMVSLHSVPKLLGHSNPERLLRDLLTEVSRSGGRAFSGAVDLALATMACHGAIRAGDVISTEEASALLKALDLADFAGHCPHGRPVVAFTSWAELERKVGRR